MGSFYKMNSKLIYEQSMHEASGGFLAKRHNEHLSPSIPGTRVYPYPGTTHATHATHATHPTHTTHSTHTTHATHAPQAESVRNSYHHTHPHSNVSLTHHLPTLYMGPNSPHSAAVNTQQYRESNYPIDRHSHEFSPTIDRYRNRTESNEMHHTSNSNHPSLQIVRRRPSLLPHTAQTNDYNLLNSSAAISYVNRIDRERYDLYRYAPYDSRTKGASIQSQSSMSLPSTALSQHSSAAMHLVQHGLHIVGPHQSSQIVPSHHLSQAHINQDIIDISSNKRPRLTADMRAPIHQPLLIDTRDIIEVKKEPAYTPQVEAISPTLPNEDFRQDMSPLRSSKDELLQNINKIDREILQAESQIAKARKKQQELELSTSKPNAENQESQESSTSESKQLSIAQLIYSENKAKTLKAHSQFDKLGPKIELPLYNQPSDNSIYHENKKNFIGFKKNLINFFKKRFHEKQLRERYLTETYDKLMLSWLKKLEKKETNPAKKAKDVKLREYFEKQFPELRKQREDKERFSRVGQRIRSDAELEEILDGLQEQELEDKKMRSYAVIPPILLDSRLKKHNFINRNGIVEDPMSEYKERQMLNIWTDQEKEIFREKYLQHPKNFGLISSYLDRKSVSECVQYYYLSKKSENYKQLLRKHVKKRTRALVKAQQQQQQQQQQQHQQSGALSARPSPSGASVRQQLEQQNHDISKSIAINATTIETTATTIITHSNVNVITTSSDNSVNLSVNENVNLNGPSNEKSELTIVSENEIKCENINDNDENMNDVNDIENTHKCCLCENKVENFTKSRAVTVSNMSLYGISNSNFKQGLRVCLMCHFKNVRRQCPLASCKTPRRKVKRLKLLPQQWIEMNAEERQKYCTELNIPVDAKTACPRCVMRVARRIGAIAPSDKTNAHQTNESSLNTNWSDTEIEQIKKALKEYGKNWSAISAQIRTKTVRECRYFYFNNKYKYNLNQILKEFVSNSGKTNKADSDSDEYWNEVSEGDSETSSAEEGNDRGSDTASASSPINKNVEKDFDTIRASNEKSVECSSTTNYNVEFAKLQDYKGLSASQGSLKSDYDSSATMSADEGQGNCDNERMSSSPAVNLPPRANSAMPVFPPSTNIYFQHQAVDKHVRPASHDAAFAVDMVGKVTHSPNVLRTSDSINMNARQKVPPFLINPNAPSTNPSHNSSVISRNVNKEEPTCVRDLIYQAIEMSLQSPLKPMRNTSAPSHENNGNTKLENQDLMNSTFPMPVIKRENFNDMSKQELGNNQENIEQSPRLCFKNSDLQRPEGLAVMASYSQHLAASPGHQSQPYVIMEPENYEVQDLSKKDRRMESYSPSPTYSPTSMKEKIASMHRNDYIYNYNIPPAHSNQNRSQVSEHISEIKDNTYSGGKQADAIRHQNAAYIFPERMSSQQTDLMQQQCHTSPNLNMNMNKLSSAKSNDPPPPPPPPLITTGKSQISQAFSQMSPKLSYREKLAPVSASGSGSITQGTPVTPQQAFAFNNQNRYEGLLRQMPPTHKEGGSITLGTPLIAGGSTVPIESLRRKNDAMVFDGNRQEMMARANLMYDTSNVEQYYRRSSPSGNHYSNFQQPSNYQPLHHQINKSPFHKESQLSSKQIMIDFNTSKQMLTRRGSNSSDKDVRPSTPVHCPIEPRTSHNESKLCSQNRISNYPNFAQNASSSGPAIQSPLYNERISHRENQLVATTEAHMSLNWTPRHSPQSPNYMSRQNVIHQIYNPSNMKQSVIQAPKSNSPREYRTEVISPLTHPSMRSSLSPHVQSSLYPQSHDAFTTLVNAAVAQQSLAVPNMDRRASNVLRTDLTSRSQSKEKASVEGLEKSLMDQMHQRPRSYNEISNQMDMTTDSRNKSEEKMRNMSELQEMESKGYNVAQRQHMPTSINADEYAYMIEHRRRLEMEQFSGLDRNHYKRLINEHQNTPISQSSLRYSGSREPFTREQFERELRQQDPKHSVKIKPEDVSEITHETRGSNISHPRNKISELDNEASQLFSQSFQKDNQKVNPSHGFTAANLIDAIITRQINQTNDSPNEKITNSVSSSSNSMNVSSNSNADSLFVRYRNNDKVLQSQYPNREEIVTIPDSPDPEKSYNSNERQQTSSTQNYYSQKNITLGEHIDTIISKNFSNSDNRSHNLQLESRNSPVIYGMHSITESRNSIPITSSGMLEAITSTASSLPSQSDTSVSYSPPLSSWKLRKALQQDKEIKESDERQIIRIAQNVTPKEHRMTFHSPVKCSSPTLSHYNVEPISPPLQTDNNQASINSFNPMQTTWTPTTGIHNVINNRQYFTENTVPHSNTNASAKLSQSHNVASNRTPQAQIGLSPLDYVKNRIVEVMRTTSDEEEGNKRLSTDTSHAFQHPNDKSNREESDTKANLTLDSNDRIGSSDDESNKSQLTNKLDRNSMSTNSSKKCDNISIFSRSRSSPSSTQSANQEEEDDTKNDGPPHKKIRKSIEQDFTETTIGVPESSDNTLNSAISASNDKTIKQELDSQSIAYESTISQGSAENSVNTNKHKMFDSKNKVSSTASAETGINVEKSNWEVSSASLSDTSSDKTRELKQSIYPDSPNSPGEMVIDESISNLATSSSPGDKTNSECSQSSSTAQSTQQSQITTTEIHFQNSINNDSKNTFSGSENKKLITSSSENVSLDVPNQSHSISSSIELNKTIAANALSSSSASIEQSIQSSSTTVSANQSNLANNANRSERHSPSMSTNNVSSTNVYNSGGCTAMVSNIDNSAQSSSSTSGSNMIGGSNRDISTARNVVHSDTHSDSFAYTQFTVSSSGQTTQAMQANATLPESAQQTPTATAFTIQSSAISGSGTPSITTSIATAPQYEPLSDDE